MMYKIYDITGEDAIAADSGQKVYDLIHPQLLAGASVELDFTGVEVFTSLFFNFAIGQLLKDLSPDLLNKRLQMTALNPNGRNILTRIIENAKHYYSDPQYREAVDTVLDEYAASF